MTKNFRKFRSYDEDEEEYYDRGYHEELKERRKQKRMKNAIRSRNVDDLLRDYEEYDD